MSNNGEAHFPDSAASSAAFVRWMVAGVALINLFVFGMVALSLYQSFGEIEENAELTAQNLCRMLAQDVGGDIDKIDVTLLSAADEIERRIAAGGIDGPALNAFMGRLRDRVPEISSLRATDANGIVSYGPGVKPADRVNNSDREYFVRQRDNPKGSLAITKPVFARIDKKWVVPISRPIHLPDGSFGGVVYANVPLESLTRTFATIGVGRRGSISLRDADLRVFDAYPVPPEFEKMVGEKLVVPGLLEMIQAGRDAGSYITTATVDGVERKFAARRVPDYPLYVVIGRATEEYRAQWQDRAVKTGGAVSPDHADIGVAGLSRLEASVGRHGGIGARGGKVSHRGGLHLRLGVLGRTRAGTSLHFTIVRAGDGIFPGRVPDRSAIALSHRPCRRRFPDGGA